jgi:hemolysin activation/secretion protein
MKFVLGLAIVLGISHPAFGQVPNSEQPGILAKRFEQQPPTLSKSAGVIRLPQEQLAQGLAGVAIHLSQVEVVGSTVFDKARLSALYQALLGKNVTLADVYAVARSITKLYGDQGYVLSRAVVPPQEIDPKEAVVRIEVAEAYIDKVDWPSAISRYRDLFSGYAQKITAERPSNIKTVMRYLLLAGDLPGIDVTSRFEASATNPHASTLVVEMKEKAVDLTAQIDNHGTEARGPWEYLLSATFNNVVGQHESLTATVAGATPQVTELTYAALAGKVVLNDEGLTAFSDVSYSWGSPGTAILQALQFSGTSLHTEVGFSLPVIRGRDTNFTLSALAFLSNDQAQLLGAPNSDDRLRGLRIKAEADHADEFNGITQLTAIASHGFEALGSSANGDPFLSRENGRVDFTKLEGSVSRTQKLASGLSLYGTAQGQYAFTPLLSPEECGYGGKDIGRGFDPSEITGDNCLLLSGEVRIDPTIPNSPLSQTELYAFFDYGAVSRIAPSAGTPISENAASAGLGLRLASDNFNADISAAKPLWGRPDDAWRFYLTAGAKY